MWRRMPPLPESHRPAARSVAVLVPVVAWLALAALASGASARTFTIRADGTGDFPSLGAALVSLPPPDPFDADSLIVEPGWYDEDVNLRAMSDDRRLTILAPGGPAATRVRRVHADPDGYVSMPGLRRLEGLGVAEHSSTGPFGESVDLIGCVFEGGYSVTSEVYWFPEIRACTFRGPVSLGRPNGEMTDCVFEGAQLRLGNYTGDMLFTRCTFTGPLDTLVVAASSHSNFIRFTDCTFRVADAGVWLEPRPYAYAGLRFLDCAFESLGVAIGYVQDEVWSASLGGSSASVLDASSVTFRDCGTAVRWLDADNGNITIAGATIVNAGGTALETRGIRRRFERVTILGAGGDGIRDARGFRTNTCSFPFEFLARDVSVTGAAGDGIRSDASPPTALAIQIVTVDSCRLDANGGHGLRVAGSVVNAGRSLARFNGAAAVRVDLHTGADSDGPVAPSCALRTLTLVGNLSDGIVVDEPSGTGAVLVERSIVAGSGGAGVRALSAGPGTLRWCDLWSNAGGAHDVPGWSVAGLLDADPLFCGPLGGDYTLRSDSPCGPAGPFGPMGACGVACAPTASAPDAPRGTGLTLGPNPAHGPVAFAMPAAAGAWSVEVFDAAGRAVWRARAAAGETLRWEGQGESGRVAPGVYLARVEAGGAREARRFVWLGR